MNSNLLAAAISGLILGASSLAQAQTNGPLTSHLGSDGVQQLDTSDGAKHGCKGQNACKGQGGCKTDKNACKGHNACKGQGGCKTDGAKSGDKSSCAGKGGCGSK